MTAEAMTPVSSESRGAGEGREEAAPEERFVCLQRGIYSKTSSQCCSSKGQKLDILLSQASVGSLIDITFGLRLDPVCQEGN